MEIDARWLVAHIGPTNEITVEPGGDSVAALAGQYKLPRLICQDTVGLALDAHPNAGQETIPFADLAGHSLSVFWRRRLANNGPLRYERMRQASDKAANNQH